MKSTIVLLSLLISLTSSAQNALKFDAFNDFVTTLYPGPTGNSARTIELWVKLSTISSSQQVMVDYGDMANGHRFTFNVINAIPRIEVGGFGISAPSALALGTWHHLTATYEPTGNLLQLYLDGVLVNSGNPTVVVNTGSSNGLLIGRRNDISNFFSGSIDELRVWSTVRTQAEISTNMNQEFCTFPSGLASYYKFNSGIPSGNNSGLTTLTDFSGNNNTGTLSGFSLNGTNSNWVSGNNLGGSTSSTINVTACNSYTAPSGTLYSTSGVYSDVIPNAVGCDSSITINLTLNYVDLGMVQSGNTLNALATNATYQWLDCGNGYSIIPGATSSTFIAGSPGSYAALITQGGCSDTTVCRTVVAVSINNLNEDHFRVTPNPSSGLVILNFSTVENAAEFHLKVFDARGHLILNSNLNHIKEKSIDLTDYPHGVYIFEITKGATVLHQKIV